MPMAWAQAQPWSAPQTEAVWRASVFALATVWGDFTAVDCTRAG